MQFGSEPLFDDVLPHKQLAQQVLAAKKNLSDINIPVTVSELAYGYQEREGSQDVLDAIDSINVHMLPFFAQTATTGKTSVHSHTQILIVFLGSKAWPLVQADLQYFIDNGKGKKMYLDEVSTARE